MLASLINLPTTTPAHPVVVVDNDDDTIIGPELSFHKDRHNDINDDNGNNDDDDLPIIFSPLPQEEQREILYDDPRSIPPRIDANGNIQSNLSYMTIVFDLDETLIATRLNDQAGDGSYEVKVRPGAQLLLETLHSHGYEIIIWTAGKREHAKLAIDYFNGNSNSNNSKKTTEDQQQMQKQPPPRRTLPYISYGIYRSSKWFTHGTAIVKDLKLLLNRHPANLILIENNIDAAINQLEQTIIVPEYRFDADDKEDDCMTCLQNWILNNFVVWSKSRYEMTSLRLTLEYKKKEGAKFLFLCKDRLYHIHYV